MNSHREAVDKYGSVEAAAEAFRLYLERFRNDYEKELEHDIDIPVPTHFQSHEDCYRYFDSNYSKACEYIGAVPSTFFRRVKKERNQKIKLPCWPGDDVQEDVSEEPEPEPEVVTTSEEGKKDALIRALKEENRDYKKKFKEKEDEVTGWVKKEYFFTRPTDKDLKQLPITPQMKNKGPGVPAVLITDIHYGETVDPETTSGKNKYDTEIAAKRMSILTNKVVDILTKHKIDTNYPGIVVCLGGDLFSGDIHEELTITNADCTSKLFYDLVDLISSMLRTFQRHFGNVKVYNVPGNHSRMSTKKQSKLPGNNWDTLLGGALIREFRDNENILIENSKGTELDFRIFDYKYCLTHGDELSNTSNSSISVSTLERQEEKFYKHRSSMKNPYDTLIMGHYHRTIYAGNFIVGGSMIGFSEYSKSQSYQYEKPQQVLWITHPEYGITDFQPIYLGN